MITIVAVLFLARIALRARTVEPLASVGALFMIFGALGNLTDRLVHGFTIDYLVIFSRSVINFSDILILLGLFLLLSYHSTIPH